MLILQVRGGLGNQMFQYAAIRALSIHNKNERIILYAECFKNDPQRDFSLNHLNLCMDVKIVNKSIIINVYRKIFNLIKKIIKQNVSCEKDVIKLYKLGFFEYLGNRNYLKIPDSAVPVKYFSSVFIDQMYFEKDKELIKNEFRVKTKPSNCNQEFLNCIGSSHPSVCIHVRRGDYLQYSNLLVCDEDYYEKAIIKMSELLENPSFFVFSDDIEYTRKLFKHKPGFRFVDLDNPDYEELRLMYSCENFILSNSTYSWWAQFLSENRNHVISPRYWDREQKENRLIEKDWILLETR